MKNFIFIVCFNFLFFSSFAQNPINQLNDKGEKVGPWVGYYSASNNKRYEGFFENDKPVGQFLYFSEKGHVSAKINFINDSISSSLMYHDNGNMMAKGKFINKLKVGKWFTYRSSGDLLNIFNYNNGKLDGSQYMYYPANKETQQSKLMEEYSCVYGLKHGQWNQYYELGTTKSKGNYLNGKKEGLFEYYFLNGSLDKKGRFVDDKKNGLWYFYNEDTDQMDKIIYKMGQVKKSKINKGAQ